MWAWLSMMSMSILRSRQVRSSHTSGSGPSQGRYDLARGISADHPRPTRVVDEDHHATVDAVIRPVGHVHEISRILEVGPFEHVAHLLFQRALRHARVSLKPDARARVPG